MQIVKAAEPVYVALLCLVIRPIEVMCVSCGSLQGEKLPCRRCRASAGRDV